MKKLMIVATMALMSFTMSAQEGFKIGAFVGLPVGDAGDVASFNAGLDVKYLVAISDEFNMGGAIGFTNSFSKKLEFLGQTVEVDDLQFAPIALSAQYMLADTFSVGLDIGYALGINEGLDGGLYYRPGVGYAISESVELGLSYSGISIKDADLTWSSLNLGVLFSL